MGLLSKIFGTKHERDIKKLAPLVDVIKSHERAISALSDREVRAKTIEFRRRLGEGETLDDILPEAYAVVKEAACRLFGQAWFVRGHETTWDMVHFDCQLIGGIALHEGKIAEMATGEGKTLVATLPVYLNALAGRGVHVVTASHDPYPKGHTLGSKEARPVSLYERTVVMVDVDDNPMDVEIVRLRPQPLAADRWQVPLHLSFHLSTIALIPEGDEYVGRVVLFLGARDMEGRSSEMQRQEHVVRVSPEQYEEAKSKRFGIEIQLLLREGQHRVSAGLMDLMTRQASYQRIVVTVP